MRKPRELKNGASYHVIVRINRGEFLFDEDKFKNLYLSIIKKAMKRFCFRIRNFCIMGNHIHMIVEPLKNENLSKIMQWIQSVFAIQHNKETGLKGHVWYDRFKSVIIHNIRQLIQTFLYIALNPVKAGLTENPFKYKFNGINFIKQKKYEIISPPDENLRPLFIELKKEWR